MADEKEKMVRVKVRVPSREPLGFKGYYSAGQFFPNGDSEAVIPESKLAELKAESVLAVLEVSPVDGDAPASAPEAVAPPPPDASSSSAEKTSPGRPLRK